MSTAPIDNMVIRVAVAASHAVCVCLAGDVDLTAEPDLASLVDNLVATRCTVMHVDLHGVTFAGSSLINFLSRLAGRLPSDATMTLCRPDATVLQLIELLGVPEVAA